jgi:hypothetical protein
MLKDEAEACVLSAQRTTLRHFWFAIQTIDDQFGKGYAEQHPELLGAFLQAISAEHAALRHVVGLSKTAEEVVHKMTG